MAIVVTHALVSVVPESTGSGQGTSIVGPAEWNAGHIVTGFPDTPVSSIVGSSSYTFRGSDANGYVTFSSTGPQNGIIPQGVFNLGTQLTVEQSGVGVLSVTAATTLVTIHPTPPINFGSQYAVVGFFQKAADVWTAFGNF